MAKQTEKIDIRVSELNNGGVQEKLDKEFGRVFQNIHDLNTSATDKRTVTVKLEFKPDEKRQVVALTTSFSTKLADTEPVSSTVLTGKDITTGRVEAQELKSNAPGQTYMDFEDEGVKTDVGEPVDVIEKEQQKNQGIVDFQKKRGNA
ncbi:replication terminator protein [Listeria monocytogenes]|nr:replication terminator protein [Listeria monocytogenes]